MTKTHDYTRRDWGHNYYISKVLEEGWKLKMLVIGGPFRKGECLLLNNNTDGTSRYRIDHCRPKMDPDDMWDVTASLAPREGTDDE